MVIHLLTSSSSFALLLTSPADARAVPVVELLRKYSMCLSAAGASEMQGSDLMHAVQLAGLLQQLHDRLAADGVGAIAGSVGEIEQ